MHVPEVDPLIGSDGEPYIPAWCVPLWPRLRAALVGRLAELPAATREGIVAAIAAGPGALAIREDHGVVYVGAGTAETGFLVLEIELVELLPAYGEH